MGTFKENREFVLGLIGDDWTRSKDIFSKGKRQMLSRHLKAALRDELIIVNRVSRNEIYYKKNPTDVELNLSRLSKCARQLMAEVQVFDGDYIKTLQERIKEGMTMAELSAELVEHEPERAQMAKFDECLAYLRRARGVTPSEGSWPSVRAYVMQEEIAEYQAEGYELVSMQPDGSLLMEKVKKQNG